MWALITLGLVPVAVFNVLWFTALFLAGVPFWLLSDLFS